MTLFFVSIFYCHSLHYIWLLAATTFAPISSWSLTAQSSCHSSPSTFPSHVLAPLLRPDTLLLLLLLLRMSLRLILPTTTSCSQLTIRLRPPHPTSPNCYQYTFQSILGFPFPIPHLGPYRTHSPADSPTLTFTAIPIVHFINTPPNQSFIHSPSPIFHSHLFTTYPSPIIL